MPSKLPAPDEGELRAALGPAFPIWDGLLAAAGAVRSPLERTWKPSKTPFGRMCLLQHRGRTLLYLTPEEGRVWVAVVLGGRAYQAAMAGPLPAGIKQLLAEARPYAEGRGIRFAVAEAGELPAVAELVKLKVL